MRKLLDEGRPVIGYGTGRRPEKMERAAIGIPAQSLSLSFRLSTLSDFALSPPSHHLIHQIPTPNPTQPICPSLHISSAYRSTHPKPCPVPQPPPKRSLPSASGHSKTSTQASTPRPRPLTYSRTNPFRAKARSRKETCWSGWSGVESNRVCVLG